MLPSFPIEVFEVPSQQILTTDSVTLTVDAVVYYRSLHSIINIVSILQRIPLVF